MNRLLSDPLVLSGQLALPLNSQRKITRKAEMVPSSLAHVSFLLWQISFKVSITSLVGWLFNIWQEAKTPMNSFNYPTDQKPFGVYVRVCTPYTAISSILQFLKYQLAYLKDLSIISKCSKLTNNAIKMSIKLWFGDLLVVPHRQISLVLTYLGSINRTQHGNICFNRAVIFRAPHQSARHLCCDH